MHAPVEQAQLTKLRRQYEIEDCELLERYGRTLARDSFWSFRCYMDPQLIHGWWQKDLADHLQNFYVDWKAGLRPVLMIEAPPQHGKSRSVREFIGWASGHDPNVKTIYTSYSDDLGVEANLVLQRLYDNPRFQNVFPGTRINSDNVVTQSGRYMRNSSLLEYIDRRGSFRNTTVLGQINGMGMDLGVIDDPIKGRAEAQSITTRNKTWQWLTDDFLGRFSKQAGLLFIMTRWHIDDPAGRLLEKWPNAKVLRYQAIATEDEPPYRREGEPLFPEHKPLDFLLERKKVLSQASWESIYQQNPIVVGGGLFPIEKFSIVSQLPSKYDYKATVRYVDKAGTEDGGAYTACVRMHALKDGSYFIDDVVRGQWSAQKREQMILQCAQLDRARFPNAEIWIEQEPGSGGKESAENTVRNLAGFAVRAERVTGAKELRADPYAAQVQAGNVKVLSTDWARSFIDEHEAFPSGKYKDQVDAAAGAFNKLVAANMSYDESLSWV